MAQGLGKMSGSYGNSVASDAAPRIHEIIIAKDFSKTPGGRAPKNGPFSGAVFRDTLLAPALQSIPSRFDKVVVVLDGTDTYIGSFLEEAFGGLLRKYDFALADLERILDIQGSGEFRVFRDLALEYMRDEASKARAH
jgi:hypothetical protein